MTLPNTTVQPLAASFRDPSGFLFRRDGVLYRQVNQAYQANYDFLNQSGLYDDLIKRGLLIPHQEAPIEPARPELAYRVIQPETVDFISYPYEWSFSQLRDAARATLAIQKRALKFGMTLKDSSAYNIQFHRGRPVLIDSLSFEIYPEGRPWTAYRQFCQHFLAPLYLMAMVDIRLGQLLRNYIDGIPLDLAARLLPRATYLKLPALLHIHMHAASQRRYAGKEANASGQMTKSALLGLIDSLESGIMGLRWKPAGEWSDYYDIHNYSETGLKAKEALVGEFLDQIEPRNVWDLGANTGVFSRVASRRKIPTVAFDIDPGAVELNYRQMVSEKETHLLPLVLDLTNPSPAIGWQNRERMSLSERAPAEAIIALALIHHLAISNNVPLERVAAFFSALGPRLIIEFVPKSDSQVQRLLTTREDIFSEYHKEGFEKAFCQYYELERVEKIPESERYLYLMKRK